MKTNVLLNEKVYWVGKVDDREVPFHRLTLINGTTYNSYLILSDKPTIIDTVDFSFGREYVENLKNLIELEQIKYIVINHTEPDHSGGLAALATHAKNAIIVCTEAAVYELKQMYKLFNREFLIVKSGDNLDIGGKTLRFIETPYLHTAETMVTYLEEDKILFPCDIFSTHRANYEYFNDEAENDITEDFTVYYKLIMHPHRRYVQEMIDKIKGLDIQIIAPSHGYILRKNVQSFIDIYDKHSRNTDLSKNTLILYSSMTGNTKKISEVLKTSLQKDNINVSVIDVNKTPKEEILSAIEGAQAVFFGTSTKYADLIGNMETILNELKNINLEGKIAVAFGSYGWSGEAIEVVQDYLNETNMKVLNSSDIIKETGMADVKFPIRIRFVPEGENLDELDRAAAYVGELLLS